MKKFFTLMLIGMVIFGFIACGDEELGPPRMRIKNETESTINVSFKQDGSSTQNINGIDPGLFSQFEDVAAVPTKIEGLPGDAFYEFTPAKGYDYTVVVQTNSNTYLTRTER